MKRGFFLTMSAISLLSVGAWASPKKVTAVAGAGFTTFDTVALGCNGSQNGINCNNYTSKDKVYMSGGPSAAGLEDGSYYFAVLTPGSQFNGFRDNMEGNLSDTIAGGTIGDNGSGDSLSNRTFSVINHEIVSYSGTHDIGQSPNGRDIINLMPFDDTDNNGGVYILAICQVGALSPSQCKFDAFRIQSGGTIIEFPTVSGLKYYDANVNGQWDAGEVGIPNWPIDFNNHDDGTVITDINGEFSVEVVASSYSFLEQVATNGWVQTGNTVDQTNTSGGATALLNTDKSYSLLLLDNSSVTGVNFGNVCLGAGGGRTLGFWSNKNGSAIFYSSNLAMLVALNLRTATGAEFNPTSYTSFKNWLLSANATNMAYMLSAQLAAMKLNVAKGFVSGSAFIYAPGSNSANAAGFSTVEAIMEEANTSLGLYGNTTAAGPIRSYQEALKNAIDKANNNLNFLQPSLNLCPSPVFAK